MSISVFLITIVYWGSVLNGVSMSFGVHVLGSLFSLAWLGMLMSDDEECEGSSGMMGLVVLGVSAILTYLVLPGPDK